MINSQEASAALMEIESLSRLVRQSVFYRHASTMLILWGVATFIGYLLSFFAPAAAPVIWSVVIVAGVICATIIGALNKKREGVSTFDARATAAFIAFVAFGCLWSIVFGNMAPRQIGAFWTTYFMLPYVMTGFWFGRVFVVIGMSVIALTLLGYFLAGPWFTLWMAVVNGGGLLLGGLWMRRS